MQDTQHIHTHTHIESNSRSMEYHLLVFVSFRFVHRVWPNSNARRERKNFSNNFRLFYSVAVLLCSTNAGISNVCCRLLSSSRHYTTSIQAIRLNVVRHAMMTICHTKWNDFTVYLLVTCSTVVQMSTTTTREHRIVCNCRKILLPFTMFSSEYSNSRSRYILQHIVAPEDGCGISMCKYVYDSFSLSSISSWLLLWCLCIKFFNTFNLNGLWLTWFVSDFSLSNCFIIITINYRHLPRFVFVSKYRKPMVSTATPLQNEATWRAYETN